MAADWRPSELQAGDLIYLNIARAIESDICSGVLKPGDILPTHRELADRLGVAIGTITKAYKEAEKKRLIVGRGRKGTFIQRQELGESLLSREVRLWYRDYTPSYTTPYGARMPDFSSILKKYITGLNLDPVKYWPPESHRPQHYESGVRWLKKVGLKVSPDSIVISLGNHHAILLALASELEKGDTIVAETHTYISLNAIAGFLGIKIIGVESDAEGIIPEVFEAACKRNRIKAVYCQPCVQNPTNTSMLRNRREDIVRIAQKYGVVIIEDEVLRPLIDNPPPLLKSLAPDNCYLLASPSKIVCPGLKIGYIVPPSPSMTRLVNKLRASIGFTGGLPSEVFGQMLRDGALDRYLAECKREAVIRQKIARKYLPPKLVHSHPASYFVWLELPDFWSAAEFAAEVNRQAIPAWPAATYAVDPEKAARAIRFNIGHSPNQAAFSESVNIIADILKSKPDQRMEAL